MDLDENDDEVWRSWSSDPVADLDLVLPREWTLFYPLAIHPEFLAWFRDAYEKSRSRKAGPRGRSGPGRGGETGRQTWP